VLSGDGSAQPWNTLGGLAHRASRASVGGDGGDGDGDGDGGADAQEVAAMRKAQDELKRSRLKRLGVVKFVEEVSSPDARRSRRIEAGKGGSSALGKTFGGRGGDSGGGGGGGGGGDGGDGGGGGGGGCGGGGGAEGSEGDSGGGGGDGGGGGGGGDGNEAADAARRPAGLGGSLPLLPSGRGRAAEMGAAAAAGEMAVEVMQVDTVDPLMQSFHPDMPAWLRGPSPMSPSKNGKPRSPGAGAGAGAKGSKEAFSEVLRAASAAGRGKAAAAAAACAAAHGGGAAQGGAAGGASLRTGFCTNVGAEAPAGGRAGATAVRTTATAPPPPPPPPATPPPLLPPWQEARDDAGRTYYYHPTTKATSWHRPSAQATPRTGPASARPPLSAHRPQSAPRTRPHSSGSGAPARPSLGGAGGAAERPERRAQHGRASDGHLHAQRRDGGSGCGSGSGVTSRSSTPRAGAPLMAPPPPRDLPAPPRG